ncbi:pol [Symbiodinium natans]|uniref:Pol protein n=1 Tax=Symbiodinium natans TaxID=878477 RepID=A0A812RQ98_9DINO|nr:pol [Symbiodinium natans]
MVVSLTLSVRCPRRPRHLHLCLATYLGCLATAQAWQQESSLPGLAPWYCPPIGFEEGACVRKHRFGQAPLYMESSIVPLSVKVVLAVVQEPVGEHVSGLAQILLSKIEAIRLITCTGRFSDCYHQGVVDQTMAELCSYIAGLQGRLSSLGGDDDNLCEALFRHGDGAAMLRAIAVPLQKFVEVALPRAAPPVLGNFGSRFNFEYFFAERAKAVLERGGLLQQVRLSYPPMFSPGGICSVDDHDDTTQSIGPDVAAVLAKLRQAKVGLSNFVINFGAADGECGSDEDWNADPANCLTSEGFSAIVVEGDQKFFDTLRRRYGDRTDVSMILQFLPLDNVTDLLADQLSSMPTASSSPDLLKVDVDHADCLFMREALRVVQPKVIHVEYMPQAPPPLEYVQHYQSALLKVDLHGRAEPLLLQERLWKPSAQFVWSEQQLQKKMPVDEETGGHRERHPAGSGREMTGCSLSAFLVHAPGYSLLAAGDEEAVLLRDDLQPLVGRQPDAFDAWLRGSFCNPRRMTNAPDYATWGFDFRVLADLTLSASARLQQLNQLLKAHGAHAFSLTARVES